MGIPPVANGKAEPSPVANDARLVARCRAGDEEAFRALVERYGPPCARLVGHFLDDRDEVADVVQEVFGAAFANLGRFDPSYPFWPWLARMATNRVIDRLRSARRQRERTSDTLAERPAVDPAPDEAAAAAEERWRVRQVLNRLPERHRLILVLREMEGMSAEEIAVVLKRPAATIRWRLFKARRLFRDAWLERK